jgi:hypothetical protein
MSFRLPQSLESLPTGEQALSALNAEILAEKAASLGRAARMLTQRMTALEGCRDATARAALVQSAGDAAHSLMIQRELCGMNDHRAVIDDYGIPPEVIARIGAR